jgi:glycosyltransferase involved in cell wall biosynthesis
MIFIVVPAYNEQGTIASTLRNLFKQGYKNVVVVDDGSSDNTFDVAKNEGAIVLRHVINRGQGAALQTGNEYALMRGASHVVHFDGDDQFNAADIQPAVEFLQAQNLDIVLGSRFLDNRTTMPFTKRHFIFPIGRALNTLMTGVKLTDVHNGFRILSKKALEKIKITQDRMAHNSEIVAQIKKHKLSYGEFPVEVRYMRYGQGVGGGFKVLKDWLWSYFV